MPQFNPAQAATAVDLQGSLGATEVISLLQFFNTSGKSGELVLSNLPGQSPARLYFLKGTLVHAVMGDREGLDVLMKIPSWTSGHFHFVPDVLSPRTTIDLPLQHILLESIRLHDERQKSSAAALTPEPNRRNRMKNLNILLTELVNIDGIDTAVLVGRDGFVIDGVVNSGTLDPEAIGAVISTGIGSSEVMGNELQVGDLTQTMLEFKEGIILVTPVGENAILAVVANLQTPLGNVRYQVKKRLPEIMQALI